MEPQDKLFENLKNAAESGEPKPFPGMESVWARVEDKLDNKALIRQNRKWKKWAVAASLLLCASLAYQFLKPNSEPQRPVVVDAAPTAMPETKPKTETAVAGDSLTPSIHIKPEAPQILERQLKKQQAAVVQAETVSPAADRADDMAGTADLLKDAAISPASGHANTEDAPAARAAFREPTAEYILPASHPVQQKAPPLVVINGKAMTAKDDRNIQKKVNGELADLDQADSIVVLPEPLYIINGVEYTEESLFGTNPTSPYAPLNRQEIESISILQKDEAVRTYGKKGVKGVVIIATKGGKPAPKK